MKGKVKWNSGYFTSYVFFFFPSHIHIQFHQHKLVLDGPFLTTVHVKGDTQFTLEATQWNTLQCYKLATRAILAAHIGQQDCQPAHLNPLCLSDKIHQKAS